MPLRASDPARGIFARCQHGWSPFPLRWTWAPCAFDYIVFTPFLHVFRSRARPSSCSSLPGQREVCMGGTRSSRNAVQCLGTVLILAAFCSFGYHDQLRSPAGQRAGVASPCEASPYAQSHNTTGPAGLAIRRGANQSLGSHTHPAGTSLGKHFGCPSSSTSFRVAGSRRDGGQRCNMVQLLPTVGQTRRHLLRPLFVAIGALCGGNIVDTMGANAALADISSCQQSVDVVAAPRSSASATKIAGTQTAFTAESSRSREGQRQGQTSGQTARSLCAFARSAFGSDNRTGGYRYQASRDDAGLVRLQGGSAGEHTANALAPDGGRRRHQGQGHASESVIPEPEGAPACKFTGQASGLPARVGQLHPRLGYVFGQADKGQGQDAGRLQQEGGPTPKRHRGCTRGGLAVGQLRSGARPDGQKCGGGHGRCRPDIIAGSVGRRQSGAGLSRQGSAKGHTSCQGGDQHRHQAPEAGGLQDTATSSQGGHRDLGRRGRQGGKYDDQQCPSGFNLSLSRRPTVESGRHFDECDYMESHWHSIRAEADFTSPLLAQYFAAHAEFQLGCWDIGVDVAEVDARIQDYDFSMSRDDHRSLLSL